jgi:hypothetical protein
MSSYGELVAQIQHEIRRPNDPDVEADVRYALNWAIKEISSEPWWFTQQVRRLETRAGISDYEIPEVSEIYFIEGEYPGRKVVLEKWHFEDMLPYSARQGSGTPSAFAVFGCRFRLWRTPADAYPLLVYLCGPWPEIQDDTETNPLLTHGAPLLLYRATAEVGRILRNDQMRQRAYEEFQQQRKRLRAQGWSRDATGRVTPWP